MDAIHHHRDEAKVSADSRTGPSHERLLQFVEGILWTAEPATLAITFVNDQAFAALGYPLEQWRSHPDFLINRLHPAERDDVVARIREAARGDGAPEPIEHRMRHASGRYRWFRTRISLEKGRPGEKDTLVGFMLDVTQLKHAESILQGEHRLRSLVSLLPVSLYTIDHDLKYTPVTNVAGSVNDGAPSTLQEFLQTGDPESTEILCHKRALEGESLTYETSRLGRTMQVHLAPFYNAANEVEGAIGATVDVTQYHQSEEDRIAAESKFKTLVEQSLVGIYIIQDKRFTYVNPRFAHIFGYPAETITNNLKVEDLVGETDRKKVRDNIQHRLAGFSLQYSYKGKTKDGSLRDIETHGCRTFFHGRPAILGALLDVTERNQAEAARRKAEARWRTAASGAPIIMVSCDTRGIITLSEGKGLAALNLQPNEHVGFNLYELYGNDPLLLPDGSTGKVRDAIDNVLAGKAVEGIVVLPGRYLDLRGTPLYDENGRIIGGVGITTDITERIAAEAEQRRLLEEQRQLTETANRQATELQEILGNMLDPLIACDMNGHVILINQAARALAGTAAGEELTTFTIPERLRIRDESGKTMTPDEMGLGQALQGKTVKGGLFIAYDSTRGADRHFIGNATPMVDAAGKIFGAVAVVRDITEIYEFEHLKDEFIETAAHELKTPIAIIKGYVQALLSTEEKNPTHLRMLEAIDAGTNRISSVVEDLLSISLLQMREIQILTEAFDLIPLITGLIRQPADPKHPIRLEAPQAVRVLADPARLRRVINVLLDNAVRYSPKGGPVEVKVAVDPQMATVTVRDQGIGIPKNVQCHIFERFFRAHSGTPHDYGGLGIGLALSAAILKAHGQKIWFESEEGKGSAFSFTLALAPADGP